MAASETGTAQLHGLPRSSRPVGPEMLQRDDAIVREDRRITTRQMALSLPISKGSVCHIIWVLDVQGCVRNVFLGASQSRRSISSELLAHFEAEGKTFLSRIVQADEICVHHFESEKKRQSMEWHRLPLPGRKKFKTHRQWARL